jgi:hypothetical protein
MPTRRGCQATLLFLTAVHSMSARACYHIDMPPLVTDRLSASERATVEYVRAILSAFAVTIVLDLVLSRNQSKSRSSDKYHFTARCSRVVILFGCVGVGLFTLIELGAYLSHQYMPQIVTVLMALLIAIPGVILCMAAIPGFWEMRVDDDDVTIRKLFVIRRHWKISEIERCVAVTGEMRVYVKGRKRMAFLVDGMFDNYSTFVDRMNIEQIPIIDKVR